MNRTNIQQSNVPWYQVKLTNGGHSGHRLYFGSSLHGDGCILIFDIQLELCEAVQEVEYWISFE